MIKWIVRVVTRKSIAQEIREEDLEIVADEYAAMAHGEVTASKIMLGMVTR